VTGGAGFIGSSIARRLVERGDRVRVIDDLSSGKRANLGEAVERGEIELVEASILDEAALSRVVAGVDVVFHEAAISSVSRSLAEPLTIHEVNATGTLRVLVAAQKAGVRRVVYASSASAYGDSPEPRKAETLLPRPLSPYAASKLAGEHYCAIFHAVFGLETVALRYFNVFGPQQDPASEYAAVIPRFVLAALQGRPATVFGDGEQTRDFCYVDDVVAANLAAAAAPQAAGGVFNIATGHPTSLNQILALLGEIVGRPVAHLFEPSREGDIRHSLADVARAERALGYKSTVSLVEGLRRTLEWYREDRRLGTTITRASGPRI
jgi:UDP-glucose 4-epimerase